MIFILWIIAAVAALAAAWSGAEVGATLRSSAPAAAHFAAKIEFGISLLVFVCALGLGGIMKKLDEMIVRAELTRQSAAPGAGDRSGRG